MTLLDTIFQIYQIQKLQPVLTFRNGSMLSVRNYNDFLLVLHEHFLTVAFFVSFLKRPKNVNWY